MDIIASINRFYENVPVISSSKRYWLVRTLSGELYDTFISSNYISIGYNEVSLQTVSDINRRFSDENDKIRNLKNVITDIYPSESRPGLIAGQILKFSYDIKAGDVVIIPSKYSSRISFGIVEETPLIAIDYDRLGMDDFFRRKRVRWVKEVSRNRLEPLLFKMFFSHNTINDVSKYGDLIEATLNNYFIKDDEEYVVFKVNKKEDIGAIDLFQLGFYMLKLTETFFRENGLEFDINDFDVKTNLNSEGNLKLKTKFMGGAIILALIALGINGGGGTVTFGDLEVELQTDGLIQKIIDYRDREFDREMVREIRESMDSLQIEDPNDAIELYRQFSNNRRTRE